MHTCELTGTTCLPFKNQLCEHERANIIVGQHCWEEDRRWRKDLADLRESLKGEQNSHPRRSGMWYALVSGLIANMREATHRGSIALFTNNIKRVWKKQLKLNG